MNILSLSIGISASLVIFLIVQYHFSFDRFEKDRENIYRVVSDVHVGGNLYHNGGVPAPLAGSIAKEMTGTSLVIPFHSWNGGSKVSIPQGAGVPQVFPDQRFRVLADERIFRLVPFEWLAGSAAVALSRPRAVTLTESRAKMYFPGQSAESIIGKTIFYDDSLPMTVSGVVKDLEQRSDFNFKEFISLSTIAVLFPKDYAWGEWTTINGSSQCFVKLSPGTDTGRFNAQLRNTTIKYLAADEKQYGNKTTFHLQPLADIHFSGDYYGIVADVVSKTTLYGLLALAAFLLILACINFVNLTTAQATQRAKEIGVRKTLGSSRKQLVLQFLMETFLLTLLATLLSVLLTPLLLKVFSDFIPAGLRFDLAHQPAILVFLVLLICAVSFLSGIYPALVLSAFVPVDVLKSQPGSTGSGRAWLRKGLTVSQFFIAQLFVMATLITVRQLEFMINKDMGFKKEAIISFPVAVRFLPDDNGIAEGDQRFRVLYNKLGSFPGIQMTSLSGAEPASMGTQSNLLTFKDGKKEIRSDVRKKSGDTNYLRLFQIPLLAGRNVGASDTIKEYIVNETYLHLLGFRNPEDILNKRINGRPVVGVMKDFNEESLTEHIPPTVFTAQAGSIIHVALKTQTPGGTSWSKTIENIRREFKSVYPEEDFDYHFLDEQIAHFYKSEQDISKLLKWATGLAIFISCMGLLGLVIFTTARRTREIGVRKVLGARVRQIVMLLSADFVVLVMIAFALATPVAVMVMNKWLGNFAYRTTMPWWLFAISGAGLLGISALTLGIQTFRAASANPVKSLRTE